MRVGRLLPFRRSVETQEALRKGAPSRMTGIKTRLSLRVGHLLIRDRADDAYIFSYPRSGSTWLRTILANLVDPTTGADPDRRNAKIPGVSIRNAWDIHQLRSPRLIKSHASFVRRVPRAVYLVRDGRDVLVSFYHYRVTRTGHGSEIDFREFCRRYFRGDLGPRWDENVLSWLREGTSLMGDSLKVIRFEDFKSDVVGTVMEVGRFLGIEADRERVASAVEQASLDRMRETERARQGDLAPDRTFYRGGKVGQWHEMLTGELAEEFVRVSRPALRAAGYPD
jgi:hypothetical protein